MSCKQIGISFFIQTNDSTINKIINIDGKTMRGNATKDQKANHILSAWSKADGVCFGQVTVNDKSNEITAIPKLLDTLHLEKTIVTLDAMGTQTDIASDIIQKKADYVLAIKENHKLLYQDITDYFCHAPFLEEIKQLKKGYVCTIEKSHSQIEKRFYYQTDDISWLEAMEKMERCKKVLVWWKKSWKKMMKFASKDAIIFLVYRQTLLYLRRLYEGTGI
ncbi:ISAs1 family transposase [Bacillus paranthracis]